MKLPSLFPVPRSLLFPVPRSPFPSHRGSALLIVIGMVSFMVISSVAFSIYMRTSRLPSNYLRRGTSSRMLLKSALAGAIERIDGVWRSDPDASSATDVSTGYIEGLYDDYYPGLNAREGQQPNRGNYPWTGNRFVRHVFTPFRDIAPPSDPNEPNPNEPIPVSTLTLEGLAYLPPALINDVRLQSHRTKTACWCNLAYEYGRYAFVAVDVSDCFDVNKLRANSARTSAARQRIGFSTLFADENSGLSAFNASAMRNFDARANGVGQIPFVSMADFNVYFGRGEFSPFCNYVGQSGNLAILGENDRVAANALFTTDTWFPPTNTPPGAVVERYNLSATQPFDPARFDPRNNAADVLDAADRSDELGSRMRLALGGAGMVCLYDYLDADNVPTSFALPTVETAPMVCGLALRDPDSSSGALQVKVVANEGKAVKEEYDSGVPIPSSDPPVNYKNTVTATPYELTWDTSSILLSGQAVFPFKRVAEKQYATGFKAEALVRVFLAAEDLHAYVSADSPLVVKAEADWTTPGGRISEGCVSAPVTMTRGNPMTWGQDPKEAKDAVQTFSGAATVEIDPCTLFYKIEHTRYDKAGKATTATWYTLDGVVASAPCVLDADGKEAEWWTKAKGRARKELFENVKFVAGITDKDIATGSENGDKPIDTTLLQPQAAVWVRLANNGGDDDGCVVDVVPAWGRDDSIFSKGGHNPCEDEFVNRVTCFATGGSSAPHAPLIRFVGQKGKGFPYGADAVAATAGGAPALRWAALLAADPRYNYAPQDWFSSGTFDSLGDTATWPGAIQSLLGNDHRDRDIFMFTSDQEYLQSAGELQFLPFLHDLSTDFTSHVRMTADFMELNLDYQYDDYKSASDVLNFIPDMWKTYSAPEGDPVYSLGKSGVEIVSSVGDFRVNPFTSDDRVFRAAIANTPYDWFVASTNDDLNPLLGGKVQYLSSTPKPSADDGAKYAFSSKATSASAQWRDDAVYDISDKLSALLRAKAREWDGDIKKRRNWEDVYDDVWRDFLAENEKTLFGVDLGNSCLLHGVDRKFLHGFWRECFGNRQQLFLVFLRAESLTVGGSGTASMANAQTGARGVALVWRDPEPPLYHRENRPPRGSVTTLDQWKCDNGNVPAPHRTRVLFYHQFD